MNSDLASLFSGDGRTAPTVAAWIRDYLDEKWLTIWNDQLRRLERAWEEVGEPAYGIYNRALFRSVQQALKEQALTCRPRLPGSFDLSEEHWGPEDHRERRMWTLLLDGRRKLGALVTRFYHDHTELRLPEPPTLVALEESDHDEIRRIVCRDPATWSR